MDIHRLGTVLFFMLLICGDVEPNPGPPQETSAKSEVIRKFVRCIQSVLVELIYDANNLQKPNPNNLYENDPPGWNSFKKEIKFESVQKSRSDQSFDKLVELFKREVRKMPTDIADVLNCYEKLKRSNRKTDETEKLKFKTALENYVSRNRALKNRQTVLDNIDEDLLIKALQKGTEMAKQGSLASSPDGLDNLLDAINDFLDAVEHIHPELLLPNGGEKRCLTSDKIQQVKKRRTLAQCRFKGKGKLTSKGKQCIGKRNAKKSPRTSDPQSEEASSPISTPYLYERMHSMQVEQVEQTNSPRDLEWNTYTEPQAVISEIEHSQDPLQYSSLKLDSPPPHQGIQDVCIEFPISDIRPYTKIFTETSHDGNSSHNLDLDTMEETIFNPPDDNSPVFDSPVDETNYPSSTFVSVADYSQAVNIPTTVSPLLSSVEPSISTHTLNMDIADLYETDSYQQSFPDVDAISEPIVLNNFYK